MIIQGIANIRSAWFLDIKILTCFLINLTCKYVAILTDRHCIVKKQTKTVYKQGKRTVNIAKCTNCKNIDALT